MSAERTRDADLLVVDVRRCSLDDGPGIRSVVFFKGCPLRCAWCQNPEALSSAPEVQLEPERCLGCGACAEACPEGGGRPAAGRRPAASCRLCGACVEACPGAARRIAGEAVEVRELARRLLADEPFYRRSGGGVTLSGGEPAMRPEPVGRLAAALRDRGLHVLLETCGHFDWQRARAHLLPHVSTIYFDVKLAEPAEHRRWTGVDNGRIRDNLGRLVAEGFDLLARLPLVPGVTDTRDNLLAVCALLRGLGLRRLVLLPYNPLWLAKRRALGLDLPYARESWMAPEELDRARALVRAALG